MNENTQQIWFVTGASKGIGAAITKEALENGYKVVAAARNSEAARKALGESPNLLCVKMDLTEAQSVRSAVKEAVDAFGRIDVLVNNAGYGLLGYFEEFSEELIRTQMETNVFGLMSLTREVLPVMRKQRSGWIVNFSSTSGIKSVEGGAVYSASKFAVEGFTEGLAIELKPFGINCLIVEPGAFRTDFFKKGTSFMTGDIKVADYDERRQPLMDHFTEYDGIQPGDPKKLAKALVSTLKDDNPPLRLLCGRYAAKSIDDYMQARRKEFDAWRHVTESCDFNE